MRWLLLFLLFSSCLHGEPLKISVGAEEAILMNAKTGKILFEKEGHKAAYPASTTKIATALLALSKYRNHLDQKITADREALASISPQAKKQSNYRSPAYWLETDSTHVGIKRGEELSLHDLLHAMLISSANDASNVIAQGLGGAIPKFMDETNAYLKQIGCKNTFFNNPSGLHHPAHVTTAYDLAIMAKEGLKDPIFKQIVSTVRYTCPQTNLELERTFNQTNTLLKKGTYYYPKAIGVKTGTTQAAGKNLVAAAREGDRVLIAVALGYRGARSDLYQDITKMFKAAFSETKMRRTLLPKGEQRLTERVVGGRAMLKTYLSEGLAYEFYPSEEVPVKVGVLWEIPPLPIAKGQCVGRIRVVDEQGAVLQQNSLLAFEDLKPTIWYRFTHFFSKRNLWENKRSRQIVFLVGSASMLFFLWSLRQRKTLRRPR